MKRALLAVALLSAACFSAPTQPTLTGTLHYAVDSGFASLAGDTLTVTLDDTRAVCQSGQIYGGDAAHPVRLTLDPASGQPLGAGTYFIGAPVGPRAAIDLVFAPDAPVTPSGQVELSRVSPDVAGHLKAGFAWADGGSAGTFDFDFEAAFCPAQ